MITQPHTNLFTQVDRTKDPDFSFGSWTRRKSPLGSKRASGSC
jgi:hypothetical protein